MTNERLTTEQTQAILIEAVLRLYGNLAIHTIKDRELIEKLYQIQRGEKND